MDTNIFLAFIGISTAVIVIPGPSILLIVANSLQLGTRHGLYTVAGTSIAMLIQLAIAVAGVTSLVVLLAQWFVWLRWIGILYLCYLGVTRWKSVTPLGTFDSGNRHRTGTAFGQGFLVSLTNPTTMLFFVAFFPQFLDAELPVVRQFSVMSVTFWILALIFDCSYACLTGRLGKAMTDPRLVKLRNRLSGAIMIGAALGLALARN